MSAMVGQWFWQPAVGKVNRVGIAPDAVGSPYLCYQGKEDDVQLLAGVPEASIWPEWGCVALPMNRTNVLLMETVGRVTDATDEYASVRDLLLRAPDYRGLYPEPIPGQPPPYSHQIEAFCWALEAQAKGLNGFGQWSEQGCGKTRWAIDLMRYLQPEAALVVGQNSTCLQWNAELQKLWPGCAVELLVGKSLPKRIARIRAIREELASGGRPPTVFVANWEALARLEPELGKLHYGAFIADEATRMKERTTQMAKAAFKLARRSAFRVPMTGTPLGNHPGDLFALYRFIDERIFGGNFWEFMREYFRLGGFTGREFEGYNPARIGGFVERMYACAYRVTKATLRDMPEKTFDYVHLTMAGEQERLYREVAEEMYAELETTSGKATLSVANAMVKMGRLQALTAGLFPISQREGDKQAHIRGRFERLPSVKTEWLGDYVRDTLNGTDARLLIWATFKEEINSICDTLKRRGLTADQYGCIQGKVKPKDRELLRQRFNDRDSKLRVLILQIQAGSMGLDLPEADILIYHTLTFSFLDWSQSLERGHRMGRTRPYQIVVPLCKNSVDGYVLKALMWKEDVARSLLVTGFGRQIDAENS